MPFVTRCTNEACDFEARYDDEQAAGDAARDHETLAGPGHQGYVLPE